MTQKNRVVLIENDSEKENEPYVLYLEKYLKERGFSIERIRMSIKEDRQKLTETYLGDARLLVTFRLAGFEISTQSGSFLYNILPCKSIHIIPPGEEALLSKLENRKISIALFFVCLTDKGQAELEDGYGGRPWLKCCPPEEERLRAMLDEILDEIFFLRHTDAK